MDELISFEIFDRNEKFVARIVVYEDNTFFIYEANDCEVIERSPFGIEYPDEDDEIIEDNSLHVAMEDYLDSFE